FLSTQALLCEASPLRIAVVRRLASSRSRPPPGDSGSPHGVTEHGRLPFSRKGRDTPSGADSQGRAGRGGGSLLRGLGRGRAALSQGRRASAPRESRSRVRGVGRGESLGRRPAAKVAAADRQGS